MLFSRSMVVIALSMALVLIGINSQAGWLFWLAGLLISSLVVSWALSIYQVRNLSLSRRHKSHVGEDNALEVVLEIRNRGRLSRHLLEVIDEDPCQAVPVRRPRMKPARKKLREYLKDPSPPHEPSPASDGGRAAFLIPSLESDGQATISYHRGGLRRGIYPAWPGFFYSEGIIGLARHTSQVPLESKLVVYPSYTELSSFPLVDSFLHPQETSHDLTSKGAGMDYIGVREFRAGDPLRHVHWRTTARRGELVVREFERDVGTPLTILVDNQLHDGADGNGRAPLDYAARLAASVAHYAYYAGHPVSLAAYSGNDALQYNALRFEAILEWLASLNPEGLVGPEQQLEGLRPELEPGSFLCCIFPAKPFDYRRFAAAMPHLCHAALVLIDSHSGKGKGRLRPSGPTAEDIVSDLMDAPFDGLFSLSLYREGDDLKECLEKPLIIFGNSQPLKR